MNGQHTPEPWSFNHVTNRLFMNYKEVAHVCDLSPLDSGYDESIANVLLVATAPRLLAHLEALVVQMEQAGMVVPSGVTETIAKARGKA